MGSASKRKFLLETFPGLRDDHIGDSRSESFEGLVRNMTRGKGVHLCLNSLSDEKLQVHHPLPNEGPSEDAPCDVEPAKFSEW